MATSTMMKKLSMASASAALIAAFPATANAAILSHVPNDRVPPVVQSFPLGALASGGEVGDAFIDFGVDYSFGGKEGIFNDGGVVSFSGVNNSILDLISPVDGRIVVGGTKNQGLTSLLSIEAGRSAPGDLLLEAFDIQGKLLASVFNGLPLGSHGRTTMTIDRGGVFDIAFFKVSTPVGDYFGVNQVDLEAPVVAAVPEPTSTLGLLALGTLGAGSMLKRKQQQKATVKA
ncbi:PEP-CTERM sorting domain-containing protein [Argonema antarcticum]|uniref:PEP-CTERM sorting domain-containing protein n=1 Tax=Argonema antarcticum TaxID=2942763 RepID=UPI0020110BCD|nr:PEP-CTERM sorting domain-containing protein [Argonema antarcticum]MCL1475505.1 PEP-CTERM sorting domain-containing protein [Argonema antarcticum A004/B2]